MQQILGIFILIGCVFGGFVLSGGQFKIIWQPHELMIIVGAAVGALVIGNPAHVLKEMFRQIRLAMFKKKDGGEYQRQLLMLMYELLLTAGEGLKALDQHVENPEASALFQRYPMILRSQRLLAFIVDNFRLMAMGKITSHELEGVLDQEIETIDDELNQPSRSLHKIGEAMPGFGILAAVLGIVMAMHTVSEGASAGEISLRVAAAMVGTFVGIFLCYGVFDPISNMMGQTVKEEMSDFETVKVVITTHLTGKPPLLALDAGRRVVQLSSKPTFTQLEKWVQAIEGTA